MRYSRVIIKISGGALGGDGEWGFHPRSLNHIADEVLRPHQTGVQVGLVVGGGNIFRGRIGQEWGIEPAEADNIGMMATVINCLLLRGVLAGRGADVRVMTAIPINTVAEPFIRLRAIRHLEQGRIVILAGGTGNPFVTTDYAAVLRALELRAEAVLSAKDGTDGLYTADPKRDPSARLYRTAGYDTVIRENLQALDQAALVLARERKLPIHLFNFEEADAIRRICVGDQVGTFISEVSDSFA